MSTIQESDQIVQRRANLEELPALVRLLHEHGVDELLHACRLVREAGAAPAVTPASPRGVGVLVPVGPRLVEELEHDVGIVSDRRGDLTPELGE